MAEEAEWASYLYPNSSILRNKLDIRDERLWEAERFLVARRSEQIYAGLVKIPRTLDGEHLKALHAALFRDVYEWRGQFRTVTIGKRIEEGEPSRWFISPASVEPWLAAVGSTAREVPWASLQRDEMVKEIAELHTYLNFAHPFREGNGRTTRLFLEQVVQDSPFSLDFDRVESVEWNEAARDSIHPGLERPAGGPLVFDAQFRIFEKIVVDRTAESDSAGIDAVRLAQLGYQAPATAATNPTATSSRMRRPTPPMPGQSLGQER